MEPVILLLTLAVVGLLIGVSFALIRVRSRGRVVGLEPRPDAPKLTDEVRADVAEHVAELERTLAEQESAGVAEIEDDLRRQVETTLASGAAAAEQPEVDAGAEAGLLAGAGEAEAGSPTTEADQGVAPEAPAEKPRFRDRLGKARSKLSGMVGALAGRTKIDADTWDEIEEALIGADVGIDATMDLLEHLKGRVKAEGITDGDALLVALKDELKARLGGQDLALHYAEAAPSVWLFVGVNGVGKTTTIGKLGKREVLEGHKVVMAAGDTFRAAAAEQLGMWAERSGCDLVRGAEGGDPSAVIFDAVESAASKGADLVLADTAGRLHTKTNLMEELRKVRRVAEKGAGTVSEVLLVLDATTGQNGLRQAEEFAEAAQLTGVVLTKLDGSAKGGIVYAIQHKLGIPIKLVGLGEGIDDLVPFDADEFVDALFS